MNYEVKRKNQVKMEEDCENRKNMNMFEICMFERDWNMEVGIVYLC